MTPTQDTYPQSALELALAAEAHRAEQSAALWRMTPAEREAAMWRRELRHLQLVEWSAKRPHEVPRLPTGMFGSLLTSEDGEFAWIVITTPEWIEAGEPERAR